MKKCPSIMLNN